MSVSRAATTVDPAMVSGQAAAAARAVETDAPPAPAPSQRVSMKSLAIHGSAWIGIGYIATQGIRFLASILLTRLIAPDITGLMALVSVFLIGLEMFSDVGIIPSVIQNKRGDERSFLNTAWTIQVVRGFALWIVACIGAWPVAQFYGEPALLYLIPIVGFNSVISGFNSTSIPWLNRHMKLHQITILGIADQIVSYIVILTWAYFSPTVWSLVVGSIASSIFYVFASHRLVRGHRNRFHWNREDARALFRFGRWIFLSTALAFFAMQADKIMCGKLLGTEALGVYSLAVPLAFLARQLIKQLAAHVAFPVLSEVARTNPDAMAGQLRRVRGPLIGCGLLALVPLILFGRMFIEFVYDPRWWAAGWMVQILAWGAVAGIVNVTYGNALLAMGKSHLLSVLLAFHLVFLIAGALIGHSLAGEQGFVVGLAAVEWLIYPVAAVIMARRGLWQPTLDLPTFAIAIIAAAFAL